MYSAKSKVSLNQISFHNTVAKNQNIPLMQNTSPDFGYMSLKCWTKLLTVEKRNFCHVLFCKSSISKMASIKEKKLVTTSEDQLFRIRKFVLGPRKDIFNFKVLKMQFMAETKKYRTISNLHCSIQLDFLSLSRRQCVNVPSF